MNHCHIGRQVIRLVATELTFVMGVRIGVFFIIFGFHLNIDFWGVVSESRTNCRRGIASDGGVFLLPCIEGEWMC